ncbi:MAG: succinylglutamate desuccinylase/aspartoacylase family protein [Candidatus Schekmanbacteria bacterium]|nr:succinylglutamate desuccinylase/aspartoacylase family protein [Candidatus Schekmanbacteria bacterium]
MPVAVCYGVEPGPRLWLSAAVHGDELNGVEIVRRVLDALDPGRLRGAVVALPVVNVFGFMYGSRYLPDRRDLNRSFPGSARGTLGARLARLVLVEVVDRCSHGIDLHTASDQRTNLPHVRADLEDAETRRLALSFGAPAVVHARTRDGSLREAAVERGHRVLVFEGGEPLRFNEDVVEIGVAGVLRVMAALEMLEAGPAAPGRPSVVLKKPRWIRASRSGIVHLAVDRGQRVERGDLIARISDVFGRPRATLRTPVSGVVLAVSKKPHANQGDAIANVGRVS